MNDRLKKTAFALLLWGAVSLTGVSAVAFASDCVGFENMAVKILKQEYGRVYFALNADLINACDRKVSFVVDLQFVDAQGALLDNLLKPVQALPPEGRTTVLYLENLPPHVFQRIGSYIFKASDIPDSARILEGNGVTDASP